MNEQNSFDNKPNYGAQPNSGSSSPNDQPQQFSQPNSDIYPEANSNYASQQNFSNSAYTPPPSANGQYTAFPPQNNTPPEEQHYQNFKETFPAPLSASSNQYQNYYVPYAQPQYSSPEAANVTSRKSKRASLGAGGVLIVALVALIFGGAGGFSASYFLGTRNSSSNTSVTKTQVVQGSTSAPDWSVTAKNVSSSVVSILVNAGSESDKGSGVVWDDQGNIVTNNHVVSSALQGDAQIIVSMNQILYEAKIVGTDPTSDLAVIKLVSKPNKLHPITIGDPNKLLVGDPVMAVGNPLGLSGTVTTGIVSALNRPVVTKAKGTQQPIESANNLVLTNAIQTSAAINPGNSGGALVNANGELVGINSSIATLTSGQASGNIGIGFAIPSNYVKYIAKQLITTGKAKHSWLGVSVKNANVLEHGHAIVGTKINAVEPDSPADAAGLRSGDLITKINKIEVSSNKALIALVRCQPIGSDIKITYRRNNNEKTTTTKLVANPKE